MNPNDLAYIKNYNNLEIDLINLGYKKMPEYNVRLENSEANDLVSISEVIPTPSKNQRITDNVAKALKSGNINMQKNNVGLENSDSDDLEIISEINHTSSKNQLISDNVAKALKSGKHWQEQKQEAETFETSAYSRNPANSELNASDLIHYKNLN